MTENTMNPNRPNPLTATQVLSGVPFATAEFNLRRRVEELEKRLDKLDPPKPKPMTFLESVLAMKPGQAARRRGRHVKACWVSSGELHFFHDNLSLADDYMTRENLSATDWEVIDL